MEIRFIFFFPLLKAINKEEELLQMTKSQFPLLQIIIANKQTFEQLWTTAYSFHTKSEEWMNGKALVFIDEMCNFLLDK